MDQNETWHRGRPEPWPHCVIWGSSSPSPKGHSFVVCYCGQGSSLLWMPARRPYIGPMCKPRREEGNWLVYASVCVMCRVTKVK